MQFPIALYKDNQTFHVVIPDIPDLTCDGNDMADAIYNARHTVSDHLYELIQQDRPIPEPSPISRYVSSPEFAGYIWAVVHIELARLMGETAELTVRLPVALLSQLHQQHSDTDINQIILAALQAHLEKGQSEHLPH